MRVAPGERRSGHRPDVRAYLSPAGMATSPFAGDVFGSVAAEQAKCEAKGAEFPENRSCKAGWRHVKTPLLSVLAGLLCMVSNLACAMPDLSAFAVEKGTSVRINIASAGGRSLGSGGISAPSSYNVFGIGPQGAVFEELGATSAIVLDVAAGFWSICVDARSANGQPVGGGGTSLMLPAGQTTNANVAIAGSARSTFKMDFEDTTELSLFVGDGFDIGDGYQSARSLHVHRDSAAGSSYAYRTIPAGFVAGRSVTLSAHVRAGSISQRPNSTGGIRLVLETQNADGSKQRHQLAISSGNSDWTLLSETFLVPAGIQKAALIAGLEEASGSVWFDNVSLTAWRGERADNQFIGHTLPRLRGVMASPHFNEEDLRVLGQEWGANLIRWQITWTPMAESDEWAADLGKYDNWLEGALAECDKALDACEKYRILVVVDLHTVPGGRVSHDTNRMFTEAAYAQKFLAVWDKIAQRYKSRTVVYAYDLANEIAEPAQPSITWRELATQAIERIRAIDPEKRVVYEPQTWGRPAGFITVVPLSADGVIYSFHMYDPLAFTHQGVDGRPSGAIYPGIIRGTMWDKERLRKTMEPVRSFQKAYNLQIYVGEFSAVRWAPGNYLYLRDLIDLFEEYDWDWSYHAFREWNGWSVEHGSDPTNQSQSPTPTDRKQLLLHWFAKNEKP